MLAWDEENFLKKIPKDKYVVIKPFDKKITQIADDIIKKTHRVLPNLEIKHMGASALGISGQGDIDIYIFSPPKDFKHYTPILIKLFGNPKNNNEDSIAWRFEVRGYEVELYLTDPNSKPMQRQIAIFEALQKNKSLRKEYERLKEKLNGKSFREYQIKKYEFYHKILNK